MVIKRFAVCRNQKVCHATKRFAVIAFLFKSKNNYVIKKIIILKISIVFFIIKNNISREIPPRIFRLRVYVQYSKILDICYCMK